MRPGQEPSWFGSHAPAAGAGDAPEAAEAQEPPRPAAPPAQVPPPSGPPPRPLPVRRPGAAAPAEPPARPAIQKPPPRWIQHPLPAALPRPLTEPERPAPPAAAPPPAGEAAGLPALPTRQRTAGGQAPAPRHVTLGTPLSSDRPGGPAPARPDTARGSGLATQTAPAPGPAPAAAPRAGRRPGSRPAAGRLVRARPARRLRLPVVLLVLALAAAGVITAAVTAGRGAPPAARPPARPGAGRAAITAAARTRTRAAAWVTAQVGRDAIVACDPAMCAALQAARLPAADLLALTTGTPDPMGADIVLATPAVRSQFGSRLAGVYAPTVLAQFGTGAAAIEIRVIAPSGAAAYQALLSRDEQARRKVAAQLLGNPGVRMTAAARAQVLAGRVDSRLLLVLPALASVHPVQVLAFADAGPGADPAVPLRAARLSAAAPPGLTQAAYVAWLRGYLSGQRPPFDARTTATGALVTIQFSSPSPLGLLSG